MIVSYGGLKMKLVRILNFERQPVLTDDGTSYLFTKFTLNAVGVVNSQPDRNAPINTGLGMSFKRGDAANPFAVTTAVEPETSPVITDKTIRHWMMVPRRIFILSDGTTELLRSPKFGADCDAKDGPFVEAYSINEIMGNARTFIVHFQITTYLNECEENQNKYAPLLSNRFSQSHELDPNYGLTIVTNGSAYFRTDLTQTFTINPDVYRKFLFLPVPVGFKREDIKVALQSDGGRIDYSFMDVQKSDQFVAWEDNEGRNIGATSIEVNYKEAMITNADLLQSLNNVTDSYYDLKWKLGNSRTVTKDGGPEGFHKSHSGSKSWTPPKRVKKKKTP